MNYQQKVVCYGFAQSQFGNCFIAWFDNKICQISFFENQEYELGLFIKKYSQFELLQDNNKAIAYANDIFVNGIVPELYVEGTNFQQKVWEALMEIPANTTTTYAAIAQKVGKPKAVRAVGTAVGANPIAYLIPCHRVVRTDGGLGGYRWGLDVKMKILAFEQKDC